MSTPTLPAGHDDYEQLAVAWAISALEPEEQARFEAHAEGGCPRCAATVTAALEVGLELAFAVPDVEPPPALRGRVLEAAARTPGGRPAAGRSTLAIESDAWMDAGGDVVRSDRDEPVAQNGPAVDEPAGLRLLHPADGRHRASGRGRNRRRMVAALAAAALVGVSAITTWQVVGRDGGSSAGVPGKRVAALSASNGGTLATVVLTGDRVDVVTDGLRPNADRGTRYVLWGVPADGGGAPKALGSFVVTAGDLHSYPVQLVQAAGDYPVYAVSEEPNGAMPTAPSAVLARGAINR